MITVIALGVLIALLALASDEVWLVSPETAKLLQLKEDVFAFATKYPLPGVPDPSKIKKPADAN